MAVDYVVILKCGHWFNESRPDHLNIDPQQKRSCGHPDHYPRQFAAVSFLGDDVEWPDEVWTVTRTDNAPLADDESYDDPTETP